MSGSRVKFPTSRYANLPVSAAADLLPTSAVKRRRKYPSSPINILLLYSILLMISLPPRMIVLSTPQRLTAPISSDESSDSSSQKRPPKPKISWSSEFLPSKEPHYSFLSTVPFRSHEQPVTLNCYTSVCVACIGKIRPRCCSFFVLPRDLGRPRSVSFR